MIEMYLCWPMVVLTVFVVFYLGWLCGKLFGKRKEVSEKGLGKERGKGRHKVVDKSYEVDDMFDKELGREEDIHFYMSRSGTKVHFNGQCQGLQNADPRYVIKKSLCKYCQQRHGSMKKRTSGKTPSPEGAGAREF